MENKTFISKLGGRKFVIAVLSLLTAFGLFMGGKINSDQYMMILGAVSGIYGLANVASKK